MTSKKGFGGQAREDLLHESTRLCQAYYTLTNQHRHTHNVITFNYKGKKKKPFFKVALIAVSVGFMSLLFNPYFLFTSSTMKPRPATELVW